MTIPKVVTAFTHNSEWANEKMDYRMASCTVPDEAYTIEDLMKRHRAGLFTDVKTPIFMNEDSYTDEDSSLDDIDLEKMRFSDLVTQREHLDYLDSIGKELGGRAVEDRSLRRAETAQSGAQRSGLPSTDIVEAEG